MWWVCESLACSNYCCFAVSSTVFLWFFCGRLLLLFCSTKSEIRDNVNVWVGRVDEYSDACYCCGCFGASDGGA